MKVQTAGIPATAAATKLRHVIAFPRPRRLVLGPLRRTLGFNAVSLHMVLGWGVQNVMLGGGICLRVFRLLTPPPPRSVSFHQ